VTKVLTVTLPVVLPSYWTWQKLHWSAKRKMQDEYLLMLTPFSPPKRHRPWGCCVWVSTTVYKKVMRGDETNLVATLDKLVLDNISQPKGNKTRGLGWIVDDSPEYVKVGTPEICKIAGDVTEGTVIHFELMEGR
jgi:hypothetical protein